MKHLLSSRRSVAIIALVLVALLAIGGAATAFAGGKGKGGGGNSTAVVTSGPMSAVQVKIISYGTRLPIEGAHVRLYNDATGYNTTATTGNDGIAVFDSVPYYINYAADLSCAGQVSSIRLVTVDEPTELFTLAMLDK